MFNYPPFCRLIRITLRHKLASQLANTATQLGQVLRKKFGNRVLGPVTPLIDRIRGELIVEILIKIESSLSFAQARNAIAETVASFRQHTDHKSVTIICDVDPI